MFRNFLFVYILFSQISLQALALAADKDYTSFLKTPDDKKAVKIDEDSDPQSPIKKTFLTDDELQAVIDKLPEKEK